VDYDFVFLNEIYIFCKDLVRNASFDKLFFIFKSNSLIKLLVSFSVCFSCECISFGSLHIPDAHMILTKSFSVSFIAFPIAFSCLKAYLIL